MNFNSTDNDKLTARIQKALEEGKLKEAETVCEEFEKSFGQTGEVFFWKGRIAMKQSRWGEAISFFQQAENLDGHPAAAECRNMLNDILNQLKATRGDAKAQADEARKKASYAAQFGGAVSRSRATVRTADSSGMLKSMRKAIEGIGPSILKGLAAAKLKLIMGVIGFFAAVVGMIYLFVTNPKLREKVFGWVKGAVRLGVQQDNLVPAEALGQRRWRSSA